MKKKSVELSLSSSSLSPLKVTDLLIVGSGIAGLSAALEAAKSMRVVVATKRRAHDGSTRWAQGGIAAAVHPEDDAELHLKDTMVAGGGLCRKNRVRILVEEGTAAIDKLLQKV